MKMTVFAVIVSFSYEPTPSYTVALFNNKPEAEKFCKWCNKNIGKVQKLTGLQEDIKEFFVIPETVYKTSQGAINELKKDAV